MEISPFDTAHTTSYSRSIITALSRVVSEIFNVKKYCDLEIRVVTLKVVPFDRLPMVSY